MKNDEEVGNHMALRWIVRARNYLVYNGFLPNQLVFGKYFSLPNSSPASREKDTERVHSEGYITCNA